MQLCACKQPLPPSLKLHADIYVGTGLFRSADDVVACCDEEKAEHEGFSCQFSG